MVLTGIAQETDFMDGETKFALVFNKGELKLSVPEGTAAAAAQYLVDDLRERDVQSPLQEQQEAGVFPKDESGFSAITESQDYPEEPVVDLSDYEQPPDHDVTDTEDVDDGVGQI